MGNSLRCCLACVLPCGALDLIRIVHLNGTVEEMTSSITVAEFLKSYPNHVLTKPSSQGVVRKIIILSFDYELKKGNFYFLIPQSSLPYDHSKPKKANLISSERIKTQTITTTSKVSPVKHTDSVHEAQPKSQGHKRRRSSRGKSGVWQPHLECITEDL